MDLCVQNININSPKSAVLKRLVLGGDLPTMGVVCVLLVLLLLLLMSVVLASFGCWCWSLSTTITTTRVSRVL